MTLEDIMPTGQNRHCVTLRCPSCERTDHWGGYISNILQCTCGWYGRPNETEVELRAVRTLLSQMQIGDGE